MLVLMLCIIEHPRRLHHAAAAEGRISQLGRMRLRLRTPELPATKNVPAFRARWPSGVILAVAVVHMTRTAQASIATIQPDTLPKQNCHEIRILASILYWLVWWLLYFVEFALLRETPFRR